VAFRWGGVSVEHGRAWSTGGGRLPIASALPSRSNQGRRWGETVAVNLVPCALAPTSLFIALCDRATSSALGWAPPIRTRVEGPVGHWWRSIPTSSSLVRALNQPNEEDRAERGRCAARACERGRCEAACGRMRARLAGGCSPTGAHASEAGGCARQRMLWIYGERTRGRRATTRSCAGERAGVQHGSCAGERARWRVASVQLLPGERARVQHGGGRRARCSHRVTAGVQHGSVVGERG
jgi:hypothetical protein